MADKRIILTDPLTGDRLFPAVIADNIFNADGTPFSPEVTADKIKAGTLIPGVVASTGTDYGTSRIRNIKAGTADLTAGSSGLDSGTLYVCYV